MCIECRADIGVSQLSRVTQLNSSVVTIGFSLHRPEMVPLMARYMQKHDALFLEEPPTAEFDGMLSGSIPVDEYVLSIDSEYPQFTNLMCAALREFKSKGKKIFQVEPYLENLLVLHDFFADGGRPDELKKKDLTYLVYLAEKNATGALLAYYQTAASRSFEMTVDAVKRFARTDAARFRLRDELRAQALSPMIDNFSSSFVEAGVIHYPLKRLIARQAPRTALVTSVFLANEILQNLGQKGHLYGAGDQLTLLYMYHPEITASDRETLLAARALIYAKIITKEELSADTRPYPHLQDELLCIRITRGLSLHDCRRLFSLIRGVNTSAARQIVAEHVMEASPQLGQRLKSGSRDVNDVKGQHHHDAATL
jgi:hypothetical protein